MKKSTAEAIAQSGDRVSNSAVIQRTFSVLEAVAASGCAAAKTVATRLEIPLPTVYRLLNELADSGYLVYLKDTKRFELGPKCFELGLSFQQRLVAPHPIRQITDQLHRSLGTAAYFAIYRGSDIILTYCSDCEKHPRLRPLRFGFHEAAHATAFGKILLAGMPEPQRTDYLEARGMQVLTPQTMISREALDPHLAEVATRGIAWEHEEFLPRQTCAAVPVRNGTGMQVGAMAISTPSSKMTGRAKQLESTLREHAGLASSYLRGGSVTVPVVEHA